MIRYNGEGNGLEGNGVEEGRAAMRTIGTKKLVLNTPRAFSRRRVWQIQIIGDRDLLALQGKIAEHLPMPMVGIRRDGTIGFLNEALRRRFLLSPDRIVGRQVADVLAEHLLGPAPKWPPFLSLLRGREIDLQLRTGNGQALYTGITVAPVRMAGQTHGFIAVVRDKTAVQRSIREAKLSTAGLVATIAAHEMRNPLQAARGFVQLAKAQGDLAWLDCALQGIDEVAETIEQLLVFAKDPVPVPRWVSAREVFRKVRLFLQHRMGEARIEEDVQVDEVWADERLLRQVLLNLLANALEALGGQGTVWLRSLPAAGGVLFRVEDDGPGIAPELLPTISEPFVTTKPEGSGLGLYVSRQAMRAHGGTLEIRNRPGGGTIAEVFLPQCCLACG